MNQQEYLDEQESFLKGVEKDIAAQVRPEMDAAIRKMESLPQDATEADYAAALTDLNDILAGAIGSTMFLKQKQIAESAQQVAGGTIPLMKSPAELLESGTFQGESIANQFKKEESNG